MKPFLVLLLSALLGCSHAESPSAGGYVASSEQQPPSPAELHAVLTQEQEVPADYLWVTGTCHRNATNQLVLEGDITSTAMLATYQDPILSVTWRSNTNADLETKEYTVAKRLRAHGTTHFTLTTDAPASVASVDMAVVSGTTGE